MAPPYSIDPMDPLSFLDPRSAGGGSPPPARPSAPASGDAARELALAQVRARREQLERQLAELQAQAPDQMQIPEGLNRAQRAGYTLGMHGPPGGAGGGEPLSATERNALAELADSLSITKSAEGVIDEHGDLLGGGGLARKFADFADFWGYEGDETVRRRQLDSRLRELTMRFQKAISGAQMTEQERKFMMGFLPRYEDDEATARDKLRRAQEYLADTLRRRSQTLRQSGYAVPGYDQNIDAIMGGLNGGDEIEVPIGR